MVFGGLVAGQGKIDRHLLIGIVWASAIAGDLTSFYFGRRLGRAFLVNHGPKVQITEERLTKVEAFFDHHGGKAILIGRFVGLVRAIAPFLAGSSGLRLRRFLPYDVIGAGLWATALLLLGYIFWQCSRGGRLRGEGRSCVRDAIIVVVATVVTVRGCGSRATGGGSRRGSDAQLDCGRCSGSCCARRGALGCAAARSSCWPHHAWRARPGGDDAAAIFSVASFIVHTP